MRDFWVTHYTARENLAAVLETRILQCAFCLMCASERTRFDGVKREKSVPLQCRANLRDQRPLSGRIVFSDGVSLAEFIEHLNKHVFFWPGFSRGKNYQKNFRKKYPHPEHIGLRCKLSALRDANPDKEIFFSRYNSGATPRMPEKSMRSLRMFKPYAQRTNEPVAEIVMQHCARLPENTEYESAEGNWRRIK